MSVSTSHGARRAFGFCPNPSLRRRHAAFPRRKKKRRRDRYEAKRRLSCCALTTGYSVGGRSMHDLVPVALALAIGVAVVVWGSIAKRPWGINFQRNACTQCGTFLPQFRIPKNTRQATEGGSICPKCG